MGIYGATNKESGKVPEKHAAPGHSIFPGVRGKNGSIMKPPRVPPMIIDILQAALGAFDGVEFSGITCCPLCGGTVSGYDSRQKQFAVIREGEEERVIRVKVKRFTCKNCACLCYADEPFYPGTRIGSPVIDLYLSLCTTMPANRAARMTRALGICVNRTTWRNYHPENFPAIPSGDFFGMMLPLSILSVPSLAARVDEAAEIKGAELLAACGFPSTYQRPLHAQATGEEE